MTVWVDADACPHVIRKILFRAAQRTSRPLVMVANQDVATPPGPNIKSLRVGAGFDKADDEIVVRVEAGDLVITSDIPLAAEVIEKGARVLSFRGVPYTRENVRSRLNMRDFMETLRSSGIHSGGPSAISEREKREFANALDRYLAGG